MIDFSIRIVRNRTGTGVSAEYRIGFGEKQPTETELKALSAYFCPRLEELARQNLQAPKEWQMAAPIDSPPVGAPHK